MASSYVVCGVMCFARCVGIVMYGMELLFVGVGVLLNPVLWVNVWYVRVFVENNSVDGLVYFQVFGELESKAMRRRLDGG